MGQLIVFLQKEGWIIPGIYPKFFGLKIIWNQIYRCFGMKAIIRQSYFKVADTSFGQGPSLIFIE